MRPFSAFALVLFASSALAQLRGCTAPVYGLRMRWRMGEIEPGLQSCARAPLNAPEPALRSASCGAIGRRGWRGGVARLTAMTADENPEVRDTAAALLARFSRPRATNAWSHASRNDTDPNVKLVAAQSLRKLTPGSPSP